MSANPNPGYDYAGQDAGTQFERLGDPGKYFNAQLIEGTAQFDATGSNYGYGAVLISGSYSGTIELSSGGSIKGNALAAGELIELSVKKVSGGSAGNAIYVLKRQQ